MYVLFAQTVGKFLLLPYIQSNYQYFPLINLSEEKSGNILNVVLKNHSGFLPVQSPCHLALTCRRPPVTYPPRWRARLLTHRPRHLICFSFHSIAAASNKEHVSSPGPAPRQGTVSPTRPSYCIPPNKQFGNPFPFNLKNLVLIPRQKLVVGA